MAHQRLNRIKGVFTNLLNRRNARQRQEKTEVVMKVGVVAGDRLAIDKVFSLKAFAIGSEDKLGLLLSSRWAISQGRKRGADFPFRANLYMDIVALEYAANVRFRTSGGIWPETYGFALNPFRERI